MKKSDKINKLMLKGLLGLGAHTCVGVWFRPDLRIATKLGNLYITFQGDRSCRGRSATIALYSRFEDSERASKVVDCNPYSGKWNFVNYSQDFTAEGFVEMVIDGIKRIL